MKVNELTNKIIDEINEKINSHIFLFETNSIEQCVSEVKKIIKKIINADKIVSTQIDDENYIEMIVLRPDGKEIKKDQILFLQERLKTKPLLSEFMFYIIIEAEALNESSSNKLLKTIEEPCDNTIGFLITKNRDLLLPTIKSRCEIDEMIFINEENITIYDDELLEIATKIVYFLENNNLLEFNIFISKDKKIKEIIKENGKIIANIIKDYYNTACKVKLCNNLDIDVINFIIKNNTYKKMISKAMYLNSVLNKNVQNMNSELLLEKIAIEL